MVKIEGIDNAYPDDILMYPTGFEDCIIGVYEEKMILVLDADKIINKLITEEGMSEVDALEHFSYNIEGSKGEGYPIYVKTEIQ
jgi:hypothetical protein